MVKSERSFTNSREHNGMFTPMHTPSTRAEFEERMNYAREQLINGKMHFAKGLRGPDSLLNVRYLPNRRIDLLSIDEMARLTANQTYQMRNMDFGEMLSDDKGR
ncbi:AVAST type 1 anti-phage system protein Avs1c [Pandoraea pulmonicola]